MHVLSIISFEIENKSKLINNLISAFFKKKLNFNIRITNVLL